MIISLTLGIVLAVIAGIAVFGLVFYILKTMKAGQKAGVITGLIIGMLAGTAVVMTAGRIVVVHGEDDAGTYLVYGSPEYEFSNGFKMNLDMGAAKGYVINDCNVDLVLEKVVYTNGVVPDFYDILILPMSVTAMPSLTVNYYFSEIPPDEVDVSSGSNSVNKYWLRTKESYEYDYGAMYYDPDVKSIQVGPVNTANDSEEEEEGED